MAIGRSIAKPTSPKAPARPVPLRTDLGPSSAKKKRKPGSADLSAGAMSPAAVTSPIPTLAPVHTGKTNADPQSQSLDVRERADFIDNVATHVLFEEMQGNFLLDWPPLGSRELLVRPSEVEWDASSEELALLDVHPDRASAVVAAKKMQDGLSSNGLKVRVYSFYRASNGVILPTLFTRQSAPRIYPAIQELDRQFRAGLLEAAEQLRALGLGLALGIVGGVTLGVAMRRIGSGTAGAIENGTARPSRVVKPGTAQSDPALPGTGRVPRTSEPEPPTIPKTTETSPEAPRTKNPSSKAPGRNVSKPVEAAPSKFREPDLADCRKIQRRYAGQGRKYGWKEAERIQHMGSRHAAGSQGNSPRKLDDPIPRGARPPSSEIPPTTAPPTKFPADWDLDKMSRAAYEVANDPNSIHSVGKNMTYINGKWSGITIEVQVLPGNNGINTAYPKQ